MDRTRLRLPGHSGTRELVAACWVLLVSVNGVIASTTIYTNQDVFYVPFSTQTSISEENAAAQVTLFASGDYGVSWHAYQSQLISAGKFSFRAGADGEFWFAVRDAATTTLPSGTTPELQVVVDRRAPVLNIEVAQSQPGTIHISWSVDDDAVAESPIGFEYRAEAEAEAWHPLPISVDVHRVGRHCEGRASWVLPVTTQLIIRATSVDRAGNRAVAERRVAMEPSSTESSSALPGPVNPPPHANTPSLMELPTPSSEKPIDFPLLPQAPTPEGASVVPGDHNPNDSAKSSPEGQWHASNADLQPPRPDGILASLVPQKLGLLAESEPSESARVPAPSEHSDEPIRLSRSRRFQMDYEIENGAAGGVHRVEAWYTNDGGRSWRHYGDDPDRQSPIEIDVPDDGTFGFRLLIQAREGLVTQPPRSGDVPDVWVTVDSLAPAARLTSARFGQGTQLGTMTIHWEASDQILGDHPIALFFGESTAGPWRKIASELPNSGNFIWPIDDRVPNQFYLRLEATDRAGNLGMDVLQNPIRRDGFAPQGTIRGIRPIGYLER